MQKTNNMSRNNDETGMKIRNIIKRRSHIPTNTSLGQTDQINFRPRMGNSDQLLKPYTADNIVKIYNSSKESQMTKKSIKTSNFWENSTKNTAANDSKMSVPQAQAVFKDIMKNKAKNNKKLFKIIKEKKQSIMPTSEAAQVNIRFSEPLPFSFTPRNSGGKMNL